jgi:hypothetical protein
LVLEYAATLAAYRIVPGAVHISRIWTDWLTKLLEGSRKFIFIDLSLACGFHPVMGALGLLAYASDPVVTNDAG